MFIRRTATRNTITGESYHTYRLVRSERVGGKVRQVTLLNLGRAISRCPKSSGPSCRRSNNLTI